MLDHVTHDIFDTYLTLFYPACSISAAGSLDQVSDSIVVFSILIGHLVISLRRSQALLTMQPGGYLRVPCCMELCSFGLVNIADWPCLVIGH